MQTTDIGQRNQDIVRDVNLARRMCRAHRPYGSALPAGRAHERCHGLFMLRHLQTRWTKAQTARPVVAILVQVF